MRFFFRSRQFKVILTILIALIAVSVIFSVIGSQLSPQANIVGTITAPFRTAATSIWNAFEDYVKQYEDKVGYLMDSEALLSGVAYSYLEKKYTTTLYNIIGNHIWEWMD